MVRTVALGKTRISAISKTVGGQFCRKPYEPLISCERILISAVRVFIVQGNPTHDKIEIDLMRGTRFHKSKKLYPLAVLVIIIIILRVCVCFF